ncbi:RnfH family protein [Pseudomonas sp. NCCP-436]|uniref:RnfH family protein n=1 Tax=Pseudomonas sp. NCCP-436 TaxID=2842481 RepID=UPI001C7FC9A3|nr:RnfH family protein [Pseudomonas sp. NCCP-436]GIZ12303.1 UPF0125 protein [Pseudomonas sp. NCCP-436]
MAEQCIAIEVACALPQRQMLLRLNVAPGTTLREAAQASGLQQTFPEFDLQTAPLGIFGKRILKPEEYVLEGGERVEIYRPLVADPKEVRKLRAARARARAAGEADS